MFAPCNWMFCLQESKVLKFLGFMWNPLSWVMEAAAVMAIVLANGDKISLASSRFFSSTPPSRFGKRTTPGARPRSSWPILPLGHP